LLFQYGAFTADDTARTADAFLAYAPGLPAAALDQLFIYAFYARKNTLTPVLVGVAAVGIYLAFAVTLLPRFGYLALAAANSAQWIGHAIILGLLLWRVVGRLPGLVRTSLVATVASILVAGALALVSSLSGLVHAEGTLTLASVLAICAAASGGVYLALLTAFRLPEVDTLRELILRRLRARSA
jgi:putative peptidoglycan lipid II flippase